jgi:NAD(P)-dependent dehydrogenase (short-subunit alcohol dehydrogenase family)
VSEEKTRVFITGGTGYIGRRLIPILQRQGCAVRALVRAGSERKVPPGCEVVAGNPLDRTSFESAIEQYSTFVQLVGVPHPSPAKAQQFYDIDLVSARASIDAAAAPGRSLRLRQRRAAAPTARPTSCRAPSPRPPGAGRPHVQRAPSVVVLGPGHRWPIVPKAVLLDRRAPGLVARRRCASGS